MLVHVLIGDADCFRNNGQALVNLLLRNRERGADENVAPAHKGVHTQLFNFGSYLIKVKEWATARPQGIWRFRVLDTPATSYRVVYGWHWKTQYLWILAVVHKENKEFDYDNLNAPISARIISDWRSL